MNIKQKVKKLLKLDIHIPNTINNENNYSIALKELVKNKPELKEDKISIIKRPDGNDYFSATKRIVEGWDLLNKELPKYGDDKVKDISEYDALHSGTPMKYKPFNECIKRIKRVNFDKTLYWYPSTVGSLKARQDFVEYLYSEGFPKEKTKDFDGIGLQNVVFTCSTTQAYNIILKTITRPYDVILMTAPNYGIFSLITEKYNLKVELIELREEDNFFINSKVLEEKIDTINKQLKEEYKNKLDYIPKVAAYLNLNPHNPIGNVMSKENKKILTDMADVCLEKGVFIIDDLIYRDLCFDMNNKALPIASIPKYFNNTISLFGLSKSYGLAGFRTAAILCPKPIFTGLSQIIFEDMDSTPVLQVKAMQGAFNGSEKTKKASNKYFKKLLSEYQYRLEFTKSLIYGIDKVDQNYRSRIIRDINKYVKDEQTRKKLLTKIPYVKIRKNTMPKSGFFIILDFSECKNKYYHGKKIENEFDLLKLFYKKGKVKYLMGINIAWPYKDEFVGRANFALEIKALIHNFKIIREVTEEIYEAEDNK